MGMHLKDQDGVDWTFIVLCVSDDHPSKTATTIYNSQNLHEIARSPIDPVATNNSFIAKDFMKIVIAELQSETAKHFSQAAPSCNKRRGREMLMILQKIFSAWLSMTNSLSSYRPVMSQKLIASTKAKIF